MNRIKRSVLNFEGAAVCDFALASGGLGEDIFAVVAGNDRLGMAEHHIGFAASSALDIHEVGVWGGDKPFKFVSLSLVFVAGVEQVSIHLLNITYNIYISISPDAIMQLSCCFLFNSILLLTTALSSISFNY